MPDDTVRMQYTDTGQEQWSNWDARPIGVTGQYALPIVFTRLGRFTQRVFTFESSSARCRDMLALTLKTEGTR